MKGGQRFDREGFKSEELLASRLLFRIPRGTEIAGGAAEGSEMNVGSSIDTGESPLAEIVTNPIKKSLPNRTIRSTEIHRSAENDIARVDDMNQRRDGDAEPSRGLVDDR